MCERVKQDFRDFTFSVNPDQSSLSDQSKTLSDAFSKTCRQKKKLLKTSNFSFCQHIFNSIQLLYFQLKGVSSLFRVRMQSCLLQMCCMWERVKTIGPDTHIGSLFNSNPP